MNTESSRGPGDPTIARESTAILDVTRGHYDLVKNLKDFKMVFE